MKSLLILFLIGISLVACDRTRNNPGYDYFPDMAYSKGFEVYTANPNFADGKTLREPVEGTVPLGMIPYPYQKNDTDRLLAGRELKNPMTADSNTLGRGQVVFNRYCINCHGPIGDGNGNLFTMGLYNFKPASLVNDKMKKVPDGEIYHVITVGQGVMMAYGGLIRPEDRWKAVMYVRKLQETAPPDTTAKK
jgi:mono/diheme cytochrome c family protein